MGSTEESVAKVFGAYGNVVFCKLLPPPHPNIADCACLVRMSSIEEAKFLVEKLDGNIPAGLNQPVIIRYAASNERWDGVQKQMFAEPTMQDNIYMKGLPAGVTEEAVRAMLSGHGTVLSCKLIPPPNPGMAESACLARMGSAEEAQRVVGSLNETVPAGLGRPIVVQLASASGKPLPDRSQRPAPRPPVQPVLSALPGPAQIVQPVPRGTDGRNPPSENIYIVGLPGDITEEVLQMILGAYGGSMLACRKIVSRDSEAEGAACLIRMGSLDEAKFFVENLNGQALVGLASPVAIHFADTSEGRCAGISGTDRFSPYGPPVLSSADVRRHAREIDSGPWAEKAVAQPATPAKMVAPLVLSPAVAASPASSHVAVSPHVVPPRLLPPRVVAPPPDAATSVEGATSGESAPGTARDAANTAASAASVDLLEVPSREGWAQPVAGAQEALAGSEPSSAVGAPSSSVGGAAAAAELTDLNVVRAGPACNGA